MARCLGEILLPNGFRRKDLSHREKSQQRIWWRFWWKKNIIPPGIKDNATLHGVLLTRILLETLDAIQVPRAPQVTNGSGHCNFSYRMNAKEILKWSMGSKNQKELEALEKETGVSLEHYHKLNKFGTLPQKESRKRKCDTEAKVTTNIPFKITRDEKEKTL